MHAFWGESVESLVVYLHHALNQATLWMHRISSPFVMRRASCLECDLLCGVLLCALTVEHNRFHWTREGKERVSPPSQCTITFACSYQSYYSLPS